MGQYRTERVLTLVLCCSAALVSFAAMGEDVTLQYKFGEERTDSDPSGSERTIREGWGALWGGSGEGGTASGQIGTTLPPEEYSRRKAEIEVARAALIQRRIRELRDAPPQVNPEEHLRSYVQERDLEGLEKYRETGNPDDLYVPWRTQDPYIRRQLGEVYFKLATAQPKNEEQAGLARLGLAGVRLADESAAAGDMEDADFYFSIAEGAADILVGLDPVTATLRSVFEATTGINLVTREPLSAYERGLAVFGVVTLGYGQKFGKGIAAVQKVVSRSRIGEAAWAASLAFARHFGEAFGKFTAVGASTEDALVRYASVLREAADGPRRRMQALAAGTDDLADATVRRYPDIYKADVDWTFNMPERTRPFLANRAEADALGQAWVGPGFTRAGESSVDIYLSSDGRYVYKGPRYKASEQTWQANLERRQPDGGRILSDFHIAITDP